MVQRLETLFEEEGVVIDPTLHREATKDVLTAVKKELTLRRYSPKTHQAYLGHLKRLFNHVGKPAESITAQEIREYLLEL
jgi:hypothetical protein